MEMPFNLFYKFTCVLDDVLVPCAIVYNEYTMIISL